MSGTLGGTGSVGTVTVLNGGKVAPGANGPGKLTTGNIVFNSGSLFTVDLNGTAVGTSFDQLAVSGSVDLGNAMLVGSVGFSPPLGTQFSIINNNHSGDPIVGSFAGFVPGALEPVGGKNFLITYQGGDGNDVVLTRQEAPTVTAVTLTNGGLGTVNNVNSSIQRSEVRRLVVTFSPAVSFSGPVASAFQLHRNAANSFTLGPDADVTLAASSNGPSATSVTSKFRLSKLRRSRPRGLPRVPQSDSDVAVKFNDARDGLTVRGSW
ncbi:MAG: hypothetical protein ACJ8C4_09205 [Gemmataceae bacterium]